LIGVVLVIWLLAFLRSGILLSRAMDRARRGGPERCGNPVILGSPDAGLECSVID
jgi:hypothetical protein